LRKQQHPTGTLGYGKIYISSLDNKLHFVNSSNNDQVLGAGITSSSTPVTTLWFSQLSRRVGPSDNGVVNLLAPAPSTQATIPPANLIDGTTIRIKGSGFVYATGTTSQLSFNVNCTSGMTTVLLGSCVADMKASNPPGYVPCDLDISLTLIGTSFLPSGQFNYISRVSGSTDVTHASHFTIPYTVSATPPAEAASKSAAVTLTNFQTLSIDTNWNASGFGLIISSLKMYFE
jgi:hypothetical protein